MKRLYALLSAIMMAAAIALPSHATSKGFSSVPVQDTLIVKLKNNSKVLVVVKDLAELKNLKSQSIDSLIVLLDKHASKIEQAGKTITDEPVVVTIDRTQANSAEDVSITVTKDGTETVIKEGNKKIRIVKDVTIDIDNDKKGDKTSVSVNVGKQDTTSTDEDDDDDKKKEKVRNPKRQYDFQVDLGVSHWMNKEMMPGSSVGSVSLKPLGSRYLSLNNKWHYRLGGQASPMRLITGFNIDFHNYMFEDNVRLVQLEDRVDFIKADINLEKSKLATTTLNVPLELGLHLKNAKGKTAFKIGGGGFVGYLVSSRTKIKYSEDGDTKKSKVKDDFFLEDFQYGLTGFVGVRSLEFFVKYNMNEMFENNKGPQANAIAFGVRILKL